MTEKKMWVESVNKEKSVLVTAKFEGNYIVCRISKEMAEQGIPVEIPVLPEFTDRCTPKKRRPAILKQCHDIKEAKAKYTAYMKKHDKMLKERQQGKADEAEMIKNASKAVAKSVTDDLKKSRLKATPAEGIKEDKE